MRGKSGDSFCKQRMSALENVLGRVNVTVMRASTLATSPISYSQSCDTFRPRPAFAGRTGYGGIGFVDLIEPYACVSAFVLQHGSEHRPARIHHRLCLSGLGEALGVHVANEDRTMLANKRGAELMQKIFPPITNLGMDGFGTVLLSRPLGDSELGLQVAVETLGLKTLTLARGQKVFEAEVNADAFGGSYCFRARHDRDFDTHVEVPTPSTIFTETTGTKLVFTETVAIPHREPLAGKVDLAVLVANGANLEGQPAEASANAMALAPSQFQLAILRARPGVLLSRLLHRLDRQRQSIITACRPFKVRPKVEARQEAVLTLDHLHRQLVAVIPDRVDLTAQAGEERGVLIFNTDAKHTNRRRHSNLRFSGWSGVGRLAIHSYSIPKDSSLRKGSEKRGVLAHAALSLTGLKADVSRAN